MRLPTSAIIAIAAAGLSTLDAGLAQTTTSPTAQTPQTAAPRRTEADARAAADRNRRERELQRQRTGAPVELISSYLKANILPVPASLGVNPFYTKYVDAQGIPVISSDKVPDEALLVARDIINSMLARRPDLRAAMIARKWRTGVIAEVEMTMDIPEYSRMKRPGAPRDEPVTQEDRDYHANRSRGLGGNPTTGAEENLLGYPGTRYYGEHIFVHEFAHAIMGGGIRDVDPKMHAEIGEAYKAAMAAGKYVHPDETQALRDHQRRRVLGGRRAVVVLLELRRMLRGQRPRGHARGIRRLRPDAERAHQPRLRHPSDPDGRVPRQAAAQSDLRTGDRRGPVVR